MATRTCWRSTTLTPVSRSDTPGLLLCAEAQCHGVIDQLCQTSQPLHVELQSMLAHQAKTPQHAAAVTYGVMDVTALDLEVRACLAIVAQDAQSYTSTDNMPISNMCTHYAPMNSSG